MKTYVLTIEYNEDTEEIECLSEEVLEDRTAFYYGEIDVSEYWDEEMLKLLENGYIFGET